MTGKIVSRDEITQAVEFAKRRRPNYQPIVDFYGQVFIAQEESKDSIELGLLHLPEKNLNDHGENTFPLIRTSEFVIDEKNAGLLLKKLIHIAEGAHKELALSIDPITKALKSSDGLDLNGLFSNFLDRSEAYFKEIEDRWKINGNTLSFLIYNSITPSVVTCAEKLAENFSEDYGWNSGSCPICGNQPVISMLEEGGERSLYCSFCRHKWYVQRIYCPFCENKDSKTLRYYSSEREEEYRIDVCDGCKGFIKTVDTRKVERVIYPPLEHVATPHLDLKAIEMGFKTTL
ncbi:MAG: formate dehydrogenase accessory protein FdhE [Deltaproteobacteria bacterium]|nr:formate dehydrogenase accessory protein FdhE [Deltaproteobacteria bacterium]